MKVGKRYSSAAHSLAHRRSRRSRAWIRSSAQPPRTDWPFSCQRNPGTLSRSIVIVPSCTRGQEVPVDRVDVPEDTRLELARVDAASAQLFDEEDQVGDPQGRDDPLLDDGRVVAQFAGAYLAGGPDNPLAQLLPDVGLDAHALTHIGFITVSK